MSYFMIISSANTLDPQHRAFHYTSLCGLHFILFYFTLNKSSVFWTVMDACPNPVVLQYHSFMFCLCIIVQINSSFKRCTSNPSIWLARNIILSDKVVYWCLMFWLQSLEIFEYCCISCSKPAQINN